MQAFALNDLLAARTDSGKLYHEFLRVPALSAGIYGLAAGAVDRQSPHDQDEIYYVISGRAHFRAGDEDRPIQPGDTLYVAAQVPHKFHTITEELTLLVFFAPAEG
ncbi:MAG: cupin domain-containing protein [Chloroflexi bacterium]|nr:MAG: cupin domain-containing protein [Chloroflexota bacterium]